MIYDHPGYVYRVNSKAIWLVMTHTADEIKQEIAAVRARAGDAEADDLRACATRHWKQGKIERFE